MYRWLVLVLLAGVVALVTSCQAVQQWQLQAAREGGTKKEGPIKLAVVPKALGFDFWEKVRLGAECAASKHDDVQTVWDGVSQETDVNGQYDLLRTFITEGVDGLVYAATDAKVLAQVTQDALDNGITVVNIDSGTDPQPKEVPVMATDNVSAAENVPKLLSEELAKQGKDGGNIAFIPFQPGTGTNDQRKEGFNKGLEDYPNLKVVAEQSSQSDYVQGLQVTENILTANPNLDGIFAANEPGVLGAAEGLRRPGEVGKIVLVGWDGSPLEEQELREGVISALVVQNPFEMGYQGVEDAIKKIRENAQIESRNTSVTLVTQDNVDDPKVQAVLHPSCDNPPTS
jgi:ribose transport system substrate-binding protein